MKQKITGTGKFIIENYPAESGTYSYLTQLMLVERDGRNILREGKPAYLHEMNQEQRALFHVAGVAMNALVNSLTKVKK